MQDQLMNVIVSLLKSIIEFKNIWKLIKKRILEKIYDDWGHGPVPPWIRHCNVLRIWDDDLNVWCPIELVVDWSQFNRDV